MKRKLIVVVLALILAAGARGAFVSGSVSAAGSVTSGNLVASWVDGTLLDSYQADWTDPQYGGVAHLPWPSENGLKFGKVGEVFTLVDNSNAKRDFTGAFSSSRMPLTRPLTADITEYTASCDVTGKYKGDWGGFGMMFGWIGNSPLTVIYNEASTLSIAIEGSEWAKAFTAEALTDVVALDTPYHYEVSASEGIYTLKLNDELIGTADLSAYDIVPAVGPAQKNWRGEYTNFSLTVEEELPGPADFEQAENLVVDTVGLMNTFAVDSLTYQPYPLDWGVKVAKIDNYYTRVDNAKVPTITDAHTAVYIPVSKNLSGAASYMVSANIKATKKSNWGGLGLVVGKDTAKNAPVVVWAGFDSGAVCVGYDLSEGKAYPASEQTFTVGTAFDMAVIVTGSNLDIYIDTIYIGSVTVGVEFTPAPGIDFKNYQAEFSNVVCKTLTEGLAPAEYTIRCYSNNVEIKTMTYTYGTAKTLESSERTGYQFNGWRLAPNLSDAAISSLSATTGGDLMLFCDYSLLKYAINYYDGSAKITDTGLPQNYDFKSYIELKAPAAKEGYTFAGWYNNAQFTGDAVEAIDIGETGEKTFYAKYTKNEEKPEGCKNASAAAAMIPALLMAAAVFTKKRFK